MNLPKPVTFTVKSTESTESTNNRSKSTKPTNTRVTSTDSTIVKIDSILDAVQSIESPIAARFIDQLIKWRTNTILEFGVLQKQSPARILDFITYPVVDGKRVSKYAYYDFSRVETVNGTMTIPLGRQGVDANTIMSLVAKQLGIAAPVMHPISIPVASVTASASSRTRFMRAIIRERASILDRVFATTRSIFSSYADASVIQGGERPTPAQLDTWTCAAFSNVKVHVDIGPACTSRVRSSATFTPVEPSNHGVGKMRHALWNLTKAVPKFARETGNTRAAAIATATAEKLKKLDALMSVYERTVQAQKTFSQLEKSIGDAFAFINPRVGDWNATGVTNDDAMRTLNGALEIYKSEVDEIVKFLPKKIQTAAIGSVAAAVTAPPPPPAPPAPPVPPPPPARIQKIKEHVSTARAANAVDASAVSKTNAQIRRYQDELVRVHARLEMYKQQMASRAAANREARKKEATRKERTAAKLNALEGMIKEGDAIMKTLKSKIAERDDELKRVGAALNTAYAKNEKLEMKIRNRNGKIRQLELALKASVVAGLLVATVPFFMSRNTRAWVTLKSRGNASTKKLLAQIQTLPSPSFTTRTTVPRIAAPRVNAPRIAAPHVNVPRIAAPRVNVPRIEATDMANASYDPNIMHVAGLAAAALGIKSLISKRLRHASAVRRERMDEHVPTKTELNAWNRSTRSTRSTRSNRQNTREYMNEHIPPPPPPPTTLQRMYRAYGNQLYKRRD